MDLKRQFTVQAVTDTAMMALKTEDLGKVYSEFPDIYAELFLSAYNRYKMTKKIKDQTIQKIQELYQNESSASEYFEE